MFAETAKRGNRWSSITFRLGKTIVLYHSSCWYNLHLTVLKKVSIVSLFDSLVQLLHNLHVTVLKLSIVSSILAALAVYTRSPTAYTYEALKGMGILQLPSISTLKGFTSFNVEQAAFSEERISHARKQYDKMMEAKHSAKEGASILQKHGAVLQDGFGC